MSQTTLNAHWAFFNAPKKNDLLTAIAVRDAEELQLRKAREEIRAALRAGMADWPSVITKQALFIREYARISDSAPALKPRFRMQGSFAYDTANDPVPPQQIDMDDGMYLPTEFINEQSGNRPIVASKGYFEAVEAILKPLCAKKGWKLKQKDTCVRVELTNRAHIDLPLYAIPLGEFNRLRETLAKSFHSQMAADAAYNGEDLVESYYRALPADQIMLAHREKGWQASDPRKIEDWFLAAVKIHGPILRRLCRYLKAWRDHQWPGQPLSSLAIMASVVSIFERLKMDFSESRDDVALLLVTEHLAAALSGRVPNPVFAYVPELDLDRKWDEEGTRDSFVERARELHARVDEALNGTDVAARSLAELQRCFGGRMTSDTSVIRKESRETEVKVYQPARVPPPVVGRTTSG